MGVLDNKIYMLGGDYLDPYAYVLTTYDTVSVYDTATDSWSEVANLPKQLSGMAVAAANGKLYSFGGADAGNNLLDQTFEYDPVADRWTERARIPGGSRIYAGAATLNGKIFLVGGYPGDKAVAIYDPATNRWSAGAPLNVGRHSFGITAAPDGYLYVAGGSNASNGSLASVEQYDPATKRWQLIPRLNDPQRWGAGSAYVGGRIYTVGGYNASMTEALQVASSFCLSKKRSSSFVLSPASPVTYTLELLPENRSLDNLRVSDELPTALRFLRFTQNPLGATYNAATRRIEWQGQLAAGTTPIPIAYQVELANAQLAPGTTVTSTATFTLGSGVSFTSTTVNVMLIADFSPSEVQVNPPAVKSGDEMTYTVTLNGANPAGGRVAVLDVLPQGVEYVPNSLTYTLGTGRYQADTRTVVWAGEIPSLQYGTAEFDYIWGDSDGNGTLPNVRMQWTDIRDTGLAVAGYDDSYQCGLPIGFGFNYFGSTQNEFCVSTNGFISFDEAGSYDLSDDCPLPSTNGNHSIIAGIWDDLILERGITYQTLGTAPTRSLVVQWTGARRYGIGSATLADFQVVLHENGNIQVQVLTAGALTGTTSVTGLEDRTEERGTTYACYKANSLHDNLAIRFVQSGSGYQGTQFSFRVKNSAGGGVNKTVVNAVTITSASGVVTRTATTQLNPLSLRNSTVTASASEILPGKPVSYTIAVRNSGLINANAILTTTIPTATSVVIGSLRCSVGLCEVRGDQLHWAGTVLPDQPIAINFALELVKPVRDRTAIHLNVRLNDGYGQEFAQTLTLLARRSDLSASFIQVVPSFLAPGESALVTLFARNIGAITTDATLALPIPAGLTVLEDTLDCTTGTCALAAGTVTWEGRVPPRGLVQASFRVQTPITANYGDSFTATFRARDLAWDEEFSAPMQLLVAHGFYFAIIGVPPFPSYLYLPNIQRAEEPPLQATPVEAQPATFWLLPVGVSEP